MQYPLKSHDTMSATCILLAMPWSPTGWLPLLLYADQYVNYSAHLFNWPSGTTTAIIILQIYFNGRNDLVVYVMIILSPLVCPFSVSNHHTVRHLPAHYICMSAMSHTRDTWVKRGPLLMYHDPCSEINVAKSCSSTLGSPITGIIMYLMHFTNKMADKIFAPV